MITDGIKRKNRIKNDFMHFMETFHYAHFYLELFFSELKRLKVKKMCGIFAMTHQLLFVYPRIQQCRTLFYCEMCGESVPLSVETIASIDSCNVHEFPTLELTNWMHAPNLPTAHRLYLHRRLRHAENEAQFHAHRTGCHRWCESHLPLLTSIAYLPTL